MRVVHIYVWIKFYLNLCVYAYTYIYNYTDMLKHVLHLYLENILKRGLKGTGTYVYTYISKGTS